MYVNPQPTFVQGVATIGVQKNRVNRVVPNSTQLQHNSNPFQTMVQAPMLQNGSMQNSAFQGKPTMVLKENTVQNDTKTQYGRNPFEMMVQPLSDHNGTFVQNKSMPWKGTLVANGAVLPNGTMVQDNTPFQNVIKSSTPGRVGSVRFSIQGSACVPVGMGPFPKHQTEALLFNNFVPLPTVQVHPWESQVMPTLTQAWDTPSTQNPQMSSATWVRPENTVQNSFNPMSIFGPLYSDKPQHDDDFWSSDSTCSSIHADDQIDCTDDSNIHDPKEVEQLPDHKAYGYGRDGFPYGYSDAIHASTDSCYGFAPGSSDELGILKHDQTHFRQDPYLGQGSAGGSVGDIPAEGGSGGGEGVQAQTPWRRGNRKRHTCC